MDKGTEAYEIAVQGWQAIARSVGWSLRSAYRRRDELKKAGVIFYRKTGRPPKKAVFHFPSRLRDWIAVKSVAGEKI